MAEFFESVMPNVYAYRDKLLTNSVATLQMFLLSGVFAFAIGLFLGILLTVTRKGGIRQNRIVFYIVDIAVNIMRSIPFIILLIFVIPFTRAVVGTAIGVKGAIVPLILGTVPFYTRQVETVLINVDGGKIEAARSMGSGTLGLIFRVYLREAIPELIRVTTITAISLVGLTTMAGAVGAGGLGSFAINYGQNLHHQDIVNICVIILLVFVCILQAIGTVLAKRTTNKKLITIYKKPLLKEK
jgi:D-methionine transport system permease protein